MWKSRRYNDDFGTLCCRGFERGEMMVDIFYLLIYMGIVLFTLFLAYLLIISISDQDYGASLGIFILFICFAGICALPFFK